MKAVNTATTQREENKMEDKIFYVTYRGLNVAWYNTLEDALEEATERYYNWGRDRLEVVDSDGVIYWCSEDLVY
jgi:hypothetical protein